METCIIEESFKWQVVKKKKKKAHKSPYALKHQNLKHGKTNTISQ